MSTLARSNRDAQRLSFQHRHPAQLPYVAFTTAHHPNSRATEGASSTTRIRIKLTWPNHQISRVQISVSKQFLRSARPTIRTIISRHGVLFHAAYRTTVKLRCS